MSEARRHDEWTRTGELIATLANINRGKHGRARSGSEFNLLERQRRKRQDKPATIQEFNAALGVVGQGRRKK